MAYFLLLLASAASAAATLLLRRAGTTTAQQLVFGLPQAWCYTFFALAAYGFGFLSYALALKKVPANLAYPAMTGFTLLLILVAGSLWLGEGVGPRVVLGAVLIFAGIVLISAR